MNVFWKVATSVALSVSLYAIYDNGVRVGRLEFQVCETVYVSMERLETLAYYREHPDEKAESLEDSRVTLRRFHCPAPPPAEPIPAPPNP